MKTIIIKTQKELDALPIIFNEFTYIEIRSAETINVFIARVNSRVEARGNSRVEAWDNSSVEARGNSSVVARGNSSVVARGNSSVVARGNSRVEAWGNSRVEAWDNSRVEAWDNSRVEAWGNSSVVARGNSSVEARGNSSVVARGNSRVEAFETSMIMVLSSLVIINKLLDYTTAVFKGCKESIKEKSETALSRAIPENINISFEEWLSRGHVFADGISKKLLSKKKIGDNEVFEVEEFLTKKSSFVVKRGETFSHGETIEKAIEDLRYKISDRDVSNYIHWRENKDTEISIDEAIQGYRVITGACEFGTKQFIEALGELPSKISPIAILEKTKDAFGNKQLEEFLR